MFIQFSDFSLVKYVTLQISPKNFRISLYGVSQTFFQVRNTSNFFLNFFELFPPISFKIFKLKKNSFHVLFNFLQNFLYFSRIFQNFFLFPRTQNYGFSSPQRVRIRLFRHRLSLWGPDQNLLKCCQRNRN